jgi:hypothetical protein
MKKREVTTNFEVLMYFYESWVDACKRRGVPEYMVTPEEFGAECARAIWAEIGKGKEQRGGK